MKPEDVTPELLEWLKQTAARSAEFVEREAPLVANEIVAWHFWSSICGCLFFALLTAFFVAVSYRTWEPAKREINSHGNPAPVLACIVASLAAPVCFFVGVSLNATEAIKAKVAPRVVIIQYVKGATK